MPAIATSSSQSGTDARSSRSTRALIVAAGVVAAAVVWIIAGPLAGVPLNVKSGAKTQHVQIAVVVFVSLLAGLAAWGVVALLERSKARSPRLIWLIIGGVVLVVSLAGPLGSGITQATKISLVCEHLAVASVVVPGMARTLSVRR